MKETCELCEYETLAACGVCELSGEPNLPPIDSFTGDYNFLSNFYPSKVVFDGIEYPTVEHAYQAAKTGDLEKRDLIWSLPTPGMAKRAGRKLEVRSDWKKINLDLMYDLNWQKYEDYNLAIKLMKTFPLVLVEGNTWGDDFWGMVNGSTVEGEVHWNGQNHLGRILMNIRDKLIETRV